MCALFGMREQHAAHECYSICAPASSTRRAAARPHAFAGSATAVAGAPCRLVNAHVCSCPSACAAPPRRIAAATQLTPAAAQRQQLQHCRCRAYCQAAGQRHPPAPSRERVASRCRSHTCNQRTRESGAGSGRSQRQRRSQAGARPCAFAYVCGGAGQAVRAQGYAGWQAHECRDHKACVPRLERGGWGGGGRRPREGEASRRGKTRGRSASRLRQQPRPGRTRRAGGRATQLMHLLDGCRPGSYHTPAPSPPLSTCW